MRALVVEDERKMAALLRRGLVEEGYAADVARTGKDAVDMARATPYDTIVLDVMLPGLDGFDVCRELRSSGVWTPILMLTARDRVEDRVAGLDAGADDYLTKPFSFAELLARLRALARRGLAERPTVLEAGSLHPLRLLATPVHAQGGPVVVVVGASVEEQMEALEGLLTQLLLSGPIALLLASLLGYSLAAAALRPVESMRREAEAVSAAEPGRRLPLPPADDEIARLGTTLNTMLGRLESALARERRFVSDASHELRTPLAALRTELELALRRKRPPEEIEAALHSATEETEHLCRLAEDLLVLARADDGSLPVRREWLPAAELLTAVQERYGHQAADAGRSLQIQADDQSELHVDRLRAEQALGNLVENALRHGRGRILLLARRRDGRVELHVRDEGSGFPPDFIERAFDRFSRSDSARQGPGVGLGLAIVDLIARAHGGSAHAANHDGGADAWLEIPND